MPTYDYRCTACKHEFELFQSIKAKPEKKCPQCGKNALERLIGTGAALLFKGSGFYQTDYRSESYKKSAEADSKPTTATKPSDAGNSTPPPEPKASAEATPTTAHANASPKQAAKSPSTASKTDGGKKSARPGKK